MSAAEEQEALWTGLYPDRTLRQTEVFAQRLQFGRGRNDFVECRIELDNLERCAARGLRIQDAETVQANSRRERRSELMQPLYYFGEASLSFTLSPPVMPSTW